MKQYLYAAFVLLVGGAAHAADNVKETPVASGDWTGAYAGVNAGGGFGTFRHPAVGNVSYDETAGGFLGGVQAGYNWQSGRMVYGVEADIQGSAIAPAIVESCASRIFLPNPQAAESQIRVIYESFGLNARQIGIVAQAQPKQDYYYQSRLGNRVFDLDLGPVALAFAGASTPEHQRDIDALLAAHGKQGFATHWLRHRGLDWAADLIPSFPSLQEIQP